MSAFSTAFFSGYAPVGRAGRISLVGAGPGAADLLTLRALNRLQEAEVVFYDRLVDPEVLAFCPQAECVYVGKEVGNHAWPQERICAAIVAAAVQGRRVVRLKSGDPGIFGRATEELEAARAAGIAVEIVPGVSAASAAGAALGRSLTERGQTDRVTFATATCREGDDTPDWADLARPGTTLALYMGVAKAGTIAAELLAAGLAPETQVEVVGSASTLAEKVLRTDLAHLGAAIAAAGLGNPAIILIRAPSRWRAGPNLWPPLCWPGEARPSHSARILCNTGPLISLLAQIAARARTNPKTPLQPQRRGCTLTPTKPPAWRRGFLPATKRHLTSSALMGRQQRGCTFGPPNGPRRCARFPRIFGRSSPASGPPC